jgi:N-acyl homoserine lactone hydrolase
VASHELYLLHLGQLGVEDPETGEGRFNQVPGYLIHTDSGRWILVDTGNPTALIGAPTSEPWMLLLCNTRPEDDIVPRLAQLGLTPEDIDLLVSTHFDFDHCGRHDAFAGLGIESVVQRRHLDVARSEPRHDPALWDIPGITYRAVDGDVELEPGLRLLETSGHAIGHQSLHVETSSGPVILAVDAIAMRGQLELRAVPDWYSDVDEALASIDRLARLAEETGAYIIFGHDQRQWESLPLSPRPFQRPAD